MSALSAASSVRIPAYRHYKPKKLGVVRINGRDHYLGKYDSPESWRKYHELIATFLAGTNSTPPSETPVATRRFPSVQELALRFFEFA